MRSKPFNAFVYDKRRWQKAIDYDYLIPEPATLETYKNVLILPLRWIPGTKAIFGNGLLEGGVCDNDFNFIAGLHRAADGRDANKSCVQSYIVPAQDIVDCHENVIFGGVLTDHFGHMLVDGLTRMWYIAQHPSSTMKVAFIVMPDQIFELWDMLELIGLQRDRIIIVDQPTRFDSVIVPGETSFTYGRYGYKHEWRSVMEAMRNNVEPGACKKVYLTRTGLDFSGCIGEEYFVEYYRNLGYEIVSPETLSFREQVSLMAGADSIVAPMGAIAYHIMFTKPGSELIALNRSNTMVRGVIMTAYAAQARATFVDIYKNILPEQQGGNCVFLLAPTEHWECYLRSLPASERSATAPKYDLPERMMEYLELWGNEYSTPNKFQWIRDESVPDIARRINKYLLGRSIKTNDYPEPKKIQSLRDNYALLKQWQQDVLNMAGTVEGRAMVGLPIYVQACEDRCILSGHIEPLLIDPTEMSLKLILTISDMEKSVLEVATEFSVSSDGCGLDWQGIIKASALAELPMVAGSRVYGMLELSRTAYRETVSVHAIPAEPVDAACVTFVPRLDLICHVLFGTDGLFSVFDYFKLASKEVVYCIEDLSWQNDELHMGFSLKHPFVGSALLKYSLVLAVQDENGEMVALRDNCTSKVFPASLFELPLSVENVGSGVQFCRVSVNLLRVLDEFATESSDIGVSCRYLGFFLRLCFKREGREEFVPVGRKRSAEVVAEFKRHSIIGQGLLIPSEDVNKDFKFEFDTFADALNRSVSPYIEKIAWSGDYLIMEGTLEHPLINYSGFSLSLCLVSDSKCIRDLPVKITSVEEGRRHEWHFCATASQMFNGLEYGTWQFAFVKKLQDFHSIEPFGYRRSKGSMSHFARHLLPSSDKCGIWMAEKVKGVSLGFRWVDNKTLFSYTSVAAITTLFWSNEGILNITGTVKHPLAGSDGFDCRLLLEGSGKTIDMGLEYIDSSAKVLYWKVAFPVRVVLAGQKGEWLMFFESHIADKVERKPFGYKRPEGTFAIFCNYELGSNITQFEDQNRTLGFRVGKAKRRSLFLRH